jgi:hypothetical protein
MSPSTRSKKTHTSPFGAPGRVSHDASPFYNSKLYAGLPAGRGAAAAAAPLPP